MIKTFFQRKCTYGQQIHVRYSTLLIIRELKIKTTMRLHLIPVRMDIIEKIRNNKCCQ